MGKWIKCFVIAVGIIFFTSGCSRTGIIHKNFNKTGVYTDQQEKELEEVEKQNSMILISRSENVIYLTFRGAKTEMFINNSATLSTKAKTEIGKIGEVISKYEKTKMVIAGHANATGDEDENQKLSEERAHSVKNILIKKGVNPLRIKAVVGYGELSPVSADKNESINKRVEVTLSPIK